MKTTRLRKLLEAIGLTSSHGGFYVHGSGLVPIPSARLQEIPKVISEMHLLESKRALQLARARAMVY